MHGQVAESKMYPQFILFGDSITQGSHRTLMAELSDLYQRRLDIVNRGFSGYTAPMGLELLPQFFPDKPSSGPRVRLMTVFFGANDACLPGRPQHVPLEEYKDALRQIASFQGIRHHGTRLILIAPGPVDEYQISDGQRTASHTAVYAAVCREIATDLDLPILDLWTIFMRKAGWKEGDPLIGSLEAPKNEALAALLTDGLHFSDMAYAIVYDELKELIHQRLPDDVAEEVPVVFPDWKDVQDLHI